MVATRITGLTGRQFDAESLVYQYRNRYYHAQLGRFVTRDPIEYHGGMSLYSGHFGVNAVDPLGLIETTFKIVAKSYINGAFPAGAIVPDRPGLPPTIGGIFTPVGGTATERLHIFAGLVSRLPAFNQNPFRDVKDGKYRLYTKVVVTVDCCGTDPFMTGISTDMDGGIESDPPIDWPEWLPFPSPTIKGTINLSPLNVTYPSSQTLNVDWLGWGRPNLAAEPGMQWVAWRTSFNIWHWPDIYFKCRNGVPYVSSASFAGASNFPSHRLWVDGRLTAFKAQGTLSDLWVDHPVWPGFVR